MNKAIFLDRDNTLIRDPGYFHEPEKIEFFSGVIEGLRKLRAEGFLFIVVANQSGIGRGYFPESATIAVNQKIAELLKEQGIRIEKCYYCPHAPEAGCECRKPKPALILQAAKEFEVNLKDSFFIGDTPRDMGAGRAAGTTTVLVGGEPAEMTDLHAPDILTAAERIIAHRAERRT